MGSNTSKITLDEIKKHNLEEDCWIICNRKIYDVTDFIKNHPAGKNAILKKAGTDITNDMNFHSPYAKKLLKQYFIGYLTC